MNYNNKAELLYHIREIKRIVGKENTKECQQMLELAKKIQDEKAQYNLFEVNGNQYYSTETAGNKHNKSSV